jgi:hypothetical protein
MEHESDEYLHPSEAAELLGGVSPKTISRWAKEGKLSTCERWEVTAATPPPHFATWPPAWVTSQTPMTPTHWRPWLRPSRTAPSSATTSQPIPASCHPIRGSDGDRLIPPGPGAAGAMTGTGLAWTPAGRAAGRSAP